ncbi:MAG: DUF4783 domain-containing protein [Bacteroidales bacterium]|nr:DUF4783 domain-containing protein [Bacteroidales bacterium]
MIKNKILPLIIVVLSIAALSAFSQSQNATDAMKKVSTALQTGNSKELSKYFTETVELEIMGKENFYSISQAEILLKDFFEENKPTKFVINHQGLKDVSSFAIGTLTVKNGNLRVSFFMKTENNQTLIHQLRIEQNDEGVNE